MIMLGLLLTMASCKAQHVDGLPKGHAITKVIEVTDGKATASTDSRSLILNNADGLEAEKEYNVVYEIIESRDGSLVVNLIAFEKSDRQNAKDRAYLLTLLNTKK